MTPADTARVLAKASAYDLRTVGEADVLAWHEVLADIEYTDALAAVTRHYRNRTDRLMPAHIREHVREIRAERARQAPHPVRALPSRFEDDALRSIRVRAGVAKCSEVLGAIRERLEQVRAGQPQP